MISRLSRVVVLGALSGMLIASVSLAADNPRMTPLVKVVQENAGSVVNISTERILMLRENPFWGPYGNEMDYFFGQFFGYRQPRRALKLKSVGSGAIIDESGLIVTNAHVVHMASNIFVVFNDGTQVEGRVVYESPRDDLAMIRVDAPKDLKVLKMGDSSDVLIGETVVAIGNPLGLENSVTAGVISGIEREIYSSQGDVVAQDLMQIDAPINPGNSGGALLNLNGELIGINVAVVPKAQSIGFAIPINKVKDAIASYRKNKNVRITRRPGAPSSAVRAAPEPGHPGNIWDPFDEMARIREEMDQMMRGMSPGNQGFQGMFNTNVFYQPDLDIEENEHEYLINLDISGLNRDNLSVEINQNSITVSGEYSEEVEDKGPGTKVMSRRYGSFVKTIPTPDDADTDHVMSDTSGDNMTIRIPKK